MKGNFSVCIPITLAYEGGLSTRREDPGNWTGGKIGVGQLKGTNFGIAASAHPSVDIAHLTRDEAASIYEHEYWAPAGCEKLAAGLDLCHFDGTVNSGPKNSAKWLAAAGDAPGAGPILAYSTARLHSLESFRAWATFAKGWSARVAGVEAKALAMVGAQSATIAMVGAQAANKAKTTAAVANTATVATGASAVVAASHPTVGILAGLLTAVAAILAHFLASTSGARAAVLAHAATDA